MNYIYQFPEHDIEFWFTDSRLTAIKTDRTTEDLRALMGKLRDFLRKEVTGR